MEEKHVMFQLAEILQVTGAQVLHEGATAFSAVTTDTRKICAGALFIALKGERFNAEDFAVEAFQKGADAVLVSTSCKEATKDELRRWGTVLCVEDCRKAYQQIARAWREKFSLPVVAITGSNGKTTTKDLTAAVLSVRGTVQKTWANYNNEIGLPLTLLGMEEGHTAAVVEMGMRGLHQIEALAEIAKPDVGVVINVGETHIELLGSVENIAQAKGELAEAIPAGGTVILNADNPYVAAMRERVRAGVKVLTFGVTEKTDVRAEAIRTEDAQTKFMVNYAGERHEYILPMVGKHNVYNALAAIAVGFALGMKGEEIHEGLKSAAVTKMRFEVKEIAGCHVVNDAYNASPMSMQAAIETMGELYAGRKLAVLGDMLELGDIAVSAHRVVGKQVSEANFHALITYGDMGREIAEGARAAGMERVAIATSHEEAAKLLKAEMQAGDAILFKGSRGMQMEKIIELMQQ